jgi:alpha-N-arabinofuranosidase
MQYTNPVIPGFHPDPSVCRVGDDFYLVTSSFEYFPGVPLFHSRDLVNWRQIGHCLTRPGQLDLRGCGPSGGIYAPTIRHHRGRFYLITTNVSSIGNFLVWTDDIRGPWSDPVKVESPGIDPSLLFDGDRVYYTGNGGDTETPGIYGFEIDVATGGAIGPRTRLWGGTGGAYPEGPHLYHIGAWYYLMVSEGGTEHGHMVTMARGPSPLGPFEPCPRNPILTNRSRSLGPKAIGHADLVEAPDGRWWAVCLGIRPVGYPECHHLGRETFLVPVVWDEEGWPVVGNQGTVSLAMTVEGPGPVQEPLTSPREEFDGPGLGSDWVSLRTPPSTRCLSENPGFLTLHGSAISLDDQDSPAFLGRRLEHFDVRVATLVDFEPSEEGDEAGLTVLMNHRHHYEAAVAWVDGGRRLLFRRRIGSLWKVEATVACPVGPVVLGLEGTREAWKFTYACPGRLAQTLGEGETRYLSTEVGGAFTGTFVGLYATGRGHGCQNSARFDWFDYQPQ